MDDPNITMEEYIRLQEEKAQSRGETFDWQTATYGKMEYCKNEDDSFTNLDTEYPAIVFDDTSDAALSWEPTVSPLDNNVIDFKISFDESDNEDYMVIFDENSFSCKIIYVDNLKMDSKDENDKVNMASSQSPEPTIGYIDDLNFFKDFENEFSAIAYNDLKSKSNTLIEPSIPHRDLRHPWLRYQVEGYEEGIIHSYEYRLETIWGGRLIGMSDTEMGLDVADTLCFQLGGARRRMTWRQFILALGLHTEEEMAEAKFGAYWSGSERVILDKGGIRDYWMDILSNREFLGPAPYYVFIQDPVKRLCHKMIACGISGRGQAPEKVTGVNLFYLRSMDRGIANVSYLLVQYLFRHAKRRKSGARMSGCHFIRRLTAHFGLVSDQGLRGLSVVSSELPLIDLHKLERLNVCLRFDNTWAWVARDQRGSRMLRLVPLEPLRMLLQLMRVLRLEEEMRELRQSVVGLRGVVESSITEQTRVSTWMISCMAQLMDASGRTYQAFNSTLVGSSWLSYQRRVRPRISDASTSTTPHTDDQPDP
ncbi:hypothetical protein Tco_0092680 [Tanacetum coccineum]